MRRFFEERAPNFIEFGWEHGRYADFWSLVHLISGIIFGTLALLLNIEPLYALAAITIGASVYEGLEVIAGVVEDVENSITDIVLAGVGGWVALYGFDALGVSAQHYVLILIAAIGINLLLLHQGWNAYLKRKAHKERSHKYLLMALQAITLVGILAILFAVVRWVG